MLPAQAAVCRPIGTIIGELLSGGHAVTTNCMRLKNGQFQVCAWIVKENNWIKGTDADLQTAWNLMWNKAKDLI